MKVHNSNIWLFLKSIKHTSHVSLLDHLRLRLINYSSSGQESNEMNTSAFDNDIRLRNQDMHCAFNYIKTLIKPGYSYIYSPRRTILLEEDSVVRIISKLVQ
jgi:hypothetical protein